MVKSTVHGIIFYPLKTKISANAPELATPQAPVLENNVPGDKQQSFYWLDVIPNHQTLEKIRALSHKITIWLHPFSIHPSIYPSTDSSDKGYYNLQDGSPVVVKLCNRTIYFWKCQTNFWNQVPCLFYTKHIHISKLFCQQVQVVICTTKKQWVQQSGIYLSKLIKE